MSCPWAKVEPVEPVSFQDILSEEVARDLQAKEDKKYGDAMKPAPAEGPPEIPQEVLDALGALAADDEEDKSDEMIARMLQMQFDKEYDEDLKRREQQYNASSKVRVTFDNFRRTPQNDDFESDSEEDQPVDVIERRDWDRFDSLKRQQDSMPPCGYKVENGVIVTKHDITMNGRKNACKMLSSFPPNFQTGDGENFDMKFSNKVFNSLKKHSKHTEAKRRHKIKDKKEDRATAEFGVDEFTRLLLIKWINAGVLQRVNGTISIGKEAVIIHCDTNPDYDPEECDIPPPLPAECAIKVFKTTLSEFKQRDKYIKDDHRFKDRIGKQTARKTVHLWAEKEMHNLTRLKNAGIPCPKVVALKKHVLMMSFIGKDGRAAPKLKDAVMSPADYIVAYDQVVEAMKTLYDKADLVHADLSEYNILWHEGQCHFIDVSQSVMTNNENAFSFLDRDCFNIYNFFKKKVPEVASPEDLFKSITGVRYEDKAKLNELRDSFKMKPHLVDKPGVESSYNFDKAWEDSLKSAQEEQSVPLVDPVLA